MIFSSCVNYYLLVLEGPHAFFSPDRAKASSELCQKQIITWKKVNLLKKNKQTKKLPEFKVICSMCIIL